MRREAHWNAFTSELHRLAALHGRRVGKELLDTWWEALQDLTWEEFSRGIESLSVEGEGWPKPIDLRRLVKSERHESEAERNARLDRDEEDRGFQEWRANPTQVEIDKARFGRLTKHLLESRRGVHQFDAACECCQFDLRHPVPHRHLRPGMTAGDVNWDYRVKGCCAPDEEERF